MVKQYVGVIQSPTTGQRFMVFKTGDEKYYLFSQLYPETLTTTGWQFPVLKKDLLPNYRRALSHGWGNSL